MRNWIIILVLFLSVGCSNRQSLDPAIVVDYARLNDVESAAHWIDDTIIVIPDEVNVTHRFVIGFPEGIKVGSKPAIYQISASTSDALPLDVQTQFPLHRAYSLTADRVDLVELLKGEVFVAGLARGKLTSLYDVQMGGAIDSLFASAIDDADNIAAFGADYNNGLTTFKVWAPTAKSLSLQLYDDAFKLAKNVSMVRSERSGTWEVRSNRPAIGSYYRYKITTFHPGTKQVESYEVTDPYSHALSANGEFSQVIDLESQDIKPAGWDNHKRPQTGPTAQDIIYRLNVSEYSKPDESQAPLDKGMFSAFNHQNTNSISHLNRLAKAGVTTINIMSVSDFSGSANAVKHLLVPDESLTQNPNSLWRIQELRQLIQTVHEMGMQVIVDMPAAFSANEGIDQNSVLDKIVPGYYLLRDPINGNSVKYKKAYANNTNRIMVKKLIKDTQTFWTKHYQVDGFNFSQTDQWRSPVDGAVTSLPAFIKSSEPNKSINYLANSKPRGRTNRLQIQYLSQNLLAPGVPLIVAGTEFSDPASRDNLDRQNKEWRQADAYPVDDVIYSAVEDFIAIRNSSPLFLLPSKEHIENRFDFPASKTNNENVTVLWIDDGYIDEDLIDLDPRHSQIVVIFNQTEQIKKIAVPEAGRLRLHPVQVNGGDPIVRRSQITLDQVIVPPQTTAVFVRPQ